MGWRTFWCVVVGLVLSEAEPRLCDLVIDGQIALNEKGQYLADPRCVNGNVFLALALVAVALITFFGFLQYGTSTEDLRTAITIALITVYIVLVCLVAFFGLVEKKNVELDPLTKAMITSFTAIIGIVIPSYFGATAYIQASEERTKREEAERTRADELRRKLDTHTAPTGAPETPTEQQGRIGPQAPLEGAQGPVEHRPWWRFWR